jgi:hypothetical protein
MLAPNVVSLASLISWLRTKDPEESYRYSDVHHCVFAQYLAHHGLPYGHHARGQPFARLHEKYMQVAQPPGSCPYNSMWTFGQALERALQMQENSNVHQ